MPYQSWDTRQPDYEYWDYRNGESSRSVYVHPDRRHPSPPPRRLTDDRDGGDRAPIRIGLDARARRVASGSGSRAGSDAGSAGGGRSKDGSGQHKGGRPASRSRSRSKSRDRDSGSKRGQCLSKLLDRFASAMHASLLAASTQALAKNHLASLQSFPGSSEESFVSRDAAARVDDAQWASRDRVHDMQDAFDDLMRKMGSRGGSIAAEREMDEVLSRIQKLESAVPSSATKVEASTSSQALQAALSSQIPTGPAAASSAIARPPGRLPSPPPTSYDAPPPPPDADVQMEEPGEGSDVKSKRRRAKDLLKNVMAKLEEVEDERKQMVYRVDELENLIWDQEETGGLPMTWERLESDRVARREKAASKKRKREADDGGQARPIDVDGWDALEQTRDPSGSLVGGLSGSADEAGGLKARVEELERQLQAIKGTQEGKTGPAHRVPEGGSSTTSVEDVDLLRQQVKVVGEALQKLLSERETWKQSVVAACVSRFQVDLQSRVGDLVKTHIQNTIAEMRRDGTTVSPKAMTRALAPPAKPPPEHRPHEPRPSDPRRVASEGPQLLHPAGQKTAQLQGPPMAVLPSSVSSATVAAQQKQETSGTLAQQHPPPPIPDRMVVQQTPAAPSDQPSQSDSGLQQQALYGNPIYAPVNQSGDANTRPALLHPALQSFKPQLPQASKLLAGQVKGYPHRASKSPDQPVSANLPASTPDVTGPPALVEAAKVSSRPNVPAFMAIVTRRRRILEKQIAALSADAQRQHLSDFDQLCVSYLTGQPVNEQKLVAFLKVTTGAETIQAAELQAVFPGMQGAAVMGEGDGTARSGSDNVPAPISNTGSDTNVSAAVAQHSVPERPLSGSVNGKEEGEVPMDIEEGEIEG